MKKRTLYSIGHGNRTAEELLALLQRYEIQYLLDVRSAPYSRFQPQFTKKALQTFLEQHGITYLFMGKSLGGKPKDPACYTDGAVDYEKIKEQAFFKSGIERLKTLRRENVQLAVMCSERKPQNCHRSKLIGVVLEEEKIPIMHIDEEGKLKNQAEVMSS